MKLDQVTVSKSQLILMYPALSNRMITEAANDILTNWGKYPKRRYKKSLAPVEFKRLREEYLGNPTHDTLGRKL